MRTILTVVAVGLTLSIMAPPVVAQEFVWAKRMGGTSLDFGSSVAIDGAGNVYTTGSFKGTADFDPDPAVTFPLTSAGGYYDIFVSKLDSQGNFVWAKRMGGTSHDVGLTRRASRLVPCWYSSKRLRDRSPSGRRISPNAAASAVFLASLGR